MQKVSVFLILLIFSLGSLLALYAVDAHLVASSPTHQGLFEDMWGHMSGMGGTQSSTLSYLWILPLLLIIIVIISIVGLVYFVAFPEIKPRTKGKNEETDHLAEPLTPLESISKSLTSDERKVINVLLTHNGKYLQKYISKEANLSRLKTHRIIVRLSEREIVTVKEAGNTNEVELAEWLKHSTPYSPAPKP